MKNSSIFLLALLMCQITLASTFNTVALSSTNSSWTTDPVAPSLPALSVCDNNNDGFGVFNLTLENPAILAAQSGPASDYNFSYYENATDATVDSFSISNPMAYYNYMANSQTVYYRIRNVNTNAYAVGSFVITVNQFPSIWIPNDYHLCDSNGAVGYETFDLTVMIPQVLGAIDPSTVSVQFFKDADLTSQISNPESYTNINPGIETVYIKVQNLTTGCYKTVSLNLVVDPLPQLIAPSGPYVVCDDNQDGIGVFDLVSYIPNLTQGADILVSFHETLTDAALGGTTIPSPNFYYNINAFVQTIYVRGEDPVTGCYTILPVELDVNPAPMISSLEPIAVCDQDANPQSGSTIVNLTVQTPAILAVQPLTASNYNVTYYTSQIYAESEVSPIVNQSTYFGVNGQTIWYRVENNTTGCYAVGSFQLIVNTPPLITQPNYPPYILYDYLNNGYEVFDLTTQINNILLAQTSAVVTFYPSFPDAQNNTNVITNPSSYVNVTYVQTLGIRVTNSTGCYSISTMDVVVSTEVPAPVGPYSQTFSSGATLADIIVNGVDVQWYATATNKMMATASTQSLPMDTLLVDGTTYYATQTINGMESTARLPVTAHITLGINDNEIFPLQYAPNPVKNSLTLQSTKMLQSITVYTLLGQKVVEQGCADTHITLDLSHLAAGNYILKAQGENGQKTLRIIKE